MPITSGTMFPSTQKQNKQNNLLQENIEKLYEQIKVEQPRKYEMGLIKDEPDERDYLIQSVMNKPYSIDDLPEKVIYNNEMSSVKGQGHLGACVSFATAAIKEWQEKKEYLKERKEGSKYKRDEEYDLSESWIYWNCKKIDPFPNSEGTTIRAAMKVLNKIGVPSEKAWPYTDDKNNPGKPASWSKMTAAWKKIKSYHKINSFEELLNTLYKVGPVVAGVLVFDTFYEPGTGKFAKVKMPSANQQPIGAHAIAITGYDKRYNLLWFKNSWSNSWGNQGFGTIDFNYWRNFNLNTWAVTDLDVTKEMLEGKITELER